MYNGNILKKIPVLILSLLGVLPAQAGQYVFSESGDTLIGLVEIVRASQRDTLLDIARRHGFGYQDIKLVNPGVNTWLPKEGQKVVLPSQFVLPVATKTGIVINIPEMRLYYYLPAKKGQLREVITHPLGVGQEGWATPYMRTKIIEKKERPSWYPPESIRKEYAERGTPLPTKVEAGPDNPLGDFALRLGNPEYLIHGTNKPYGVGMRVSHGCIRLYPEDIEALFFQVGLNTPVNIINQPYKIGIRDGVIYLEAHPYLIEDREKYQNNLASVADFILENAKGRNYVVDWNAAYTAIDKPTGLPIAIGMYLLSKES